MILVAYNFNHNENLDKLASKEAFMRPHRLVRPIIMTPESENGSFSLTVHCLIILPLPCPNSSSRTRPGEQLLARYLRLYQNR
jgi:hypothetical protein